MIYYFSIIIMVFLDQIAKHFAQVKLLKVSTLPLIKDVLHLTYVENTGAAFSIFKDKQVFLIGITIMVGVFIVLLLLKAIKTNEILVYRISLLLILGGAIGNIIDRVRLHYVIDFIDFRIINFAIFNIADIFVVVGTLLLSYSVLFKNVNI